MKEYLYILKVVVVTVLFILLISSALHFTVLMLTNGHILYGLVSVIVTTMIISWAIYCTPK